MPHWFEDEINDQEYISFISFDEINYIIGSI